jgi:hypothetical protein
MMDPPSAHRITVRYKPCRAAGKSPLDCPFRLELPLIDVVAPSHERLAGRDRAKHAGGCIPRVHNIRREAPHVPGQLPVRDWIQPKPPRDDMRRNPSCSKSLKPRRETVQRTNMHIKLRKCQPFRQ